MNKENKRFKFVYWTFVIAAICITGYILFQYPQPGVADQGDFDRVMNFSGLRLTPENLNDPNFIRFFDYTVTEYRIADFSREELMKRVGATSLAYLITLLSVICKLFGQDIFKTVYLALAYTVMYITGLFVIIRYLNIKNIVLLSMIILITLPVFLDGNYMVWFNSLYGEPMMITTFTLYIAAWVYYIYKRYVRKVEEKIFPLVLTIFLLAFLFLGSKLQVLSALPVLLAMLSKLLWENRGLLKKYQVAVLSSFLILLILYPLSLNFINKDINKDTQYNSVFFGILKNSAHPAQDLIDLGLNPDMAVEAGKHAYLPRDAYVRYVPHTDITRKEFNEKISNIKLIQFYATHPLRFLEGMHITADSAFHTGTTLGKYPQSYSAIPISEFNRFTLWSSFRQNLPKELSFIFIIISWVLIISFQAYKKGDPVIKNQILLLWAIMAIGLLQFPMPYIGNGEADTAKQLFLFNFIFDLMIVILLSWFISKITGFINNVKIKTKSDLIRRL